MIVVGVKGKIKYLLLYLKEAERKVPMMTNQVNGSEEFRYVAAPNDSKTKWRL